MPQPGQERSPWPAPLRPGWAVNREFEDGDVNYAVRKPAKPDPGPNTRQHERGVNWRRQRIRRRNPGAQPEPRGFRSVCKPMILQLENGWKSQKSMRGLPHGDGVHKNEAGIQQGIMLAPRLSGFQRVSPWVASAKGASVTT